MPLKIIRNDITKMNTDAIANAANNSLKKVVGICGSIFDAAGKSKLKKACKKIGYCKTGQAVITEGYKLPAKYIIHTVGPVWHGGKNDEEVLLYDCYINSLKLAFANKCESIAFPLISTGVYGFPKDKAITIAQRAIKDFLSKHDMIVYLVVFDKNSYEISKKRLFSIKQYINNNYTSFNLDTGRSIRRYLNQLDNVRSLASRSQGVEELSDAAELAQKINLDSKINLDDILLKTEETFSEMLLRVIEEKGMTDPEAYKKANVDRKHFSKIRSNKDYAPSKVTAIAFAIALEMSLDDTLDLLKKAGYTLSHSNKFDIIIEYFIKEKVYDVFEINEALFAFDQILLGV